MSNAKGLTDRLLAGALRQAVDDYRVDLAQTNLAQSRQREYVARATESVDWLIRDGWTHPGWRQQGRGDDAQ